MLYNNHFRVGYSGIAPTNNEENDTILVLLYKCEEKLYAKCAINIEIYVVSSCGYGGHFWNVVLLSQ